MQGGIIHDHIPKIPETINALAFSIMSDIEDFYDYNDNCDSYSIDSDDGGFDVSGLSFQRVITASKLIINRDNPRTKYLLLQPIMILPSQTFRPLI